MLDSAGLIKRTCSALCLKEGLERAARTVHRSRCMVPIKEGVAPSPGQDPLAASQGQGQSARITTSFLGKAVLELFCQGLVASGPEDPPPTHLILASRP